MNFYEVPFNFDAAHTKRGKPSKPVIPALASMIERECAKGMLIWLQKGGGEACFPTKNIFYTLTRLR